MNGCPFHKTPPIGFDPYGEEYLNDPAAIYQETREEKPVFWYEPIGVWIVTKRKDIDSILMEPETWSCKANGNNIEIPEKFQDILSSELMSKILIGMDAPDHTQARRVAQKGFMRPNMLALAPQIEQRANKILDKLIAESKALSSVEFLEGYCLELTTQTLMALMNLPPEDEAMMRQLRDDFFKILASSREPMVEPELSMVWDRYTKAHLHLRAIVKERRNSDALDIISVMSSAREPDGSPSLSVERIATHLTEFAAAGTDTTAQAMSNAIIFLSQHPEQCELAKSNPDLWSKVFEETVRRRPSAPFASRTATKNTHISGVEIPEGDIVWLALASANTDSITGSDLMNFDITRENLNEQSHYSFTKGRHTCLGAPLGRTQGAIGLKVAYERLANLRLSPENKSDFIPLAMLPIRRSLYVTWDK
ncbi:cytochrome P450 [Acinetobacter calcoaceticus]|uniref:cytochrome P450 n=1 Tax=Acinetobacter calcoaceticus TaxID=471 RepID=UPI00192BD720|nr:cytochrome P450 [Acinetobacter calcoaceticus]